MLAVALISIDQVSAHGGLGSFYNGGSLTCIEVNVMVILRRLEFVNKVLSPKFPLLMNEFSESTEFPDNFQLVPAYNEFTLTSTRL